MCVEGAQGEAQAVAAGWPAAVAAVRFEKGMSLAAGPSPPSRPCSLSPPPLLALARISCSRCPPSCFVHMRTCECWRCSAVCVCARVAATVSSVLQSCQSYVSLLPLVPPLLLLTVT